MTTDMVQCVTGEFCQSKRDCSKGTCDANIISILFSIDRSIYFLWKKREVVRDKVIPWSVEHDTRNEEVEIIHKYT